MCDHQRRAVLHQVMQRILDTALRLRIERRRCFVEDQHGCILQQSATYRDPLTLATRK